MDQYAHEFNDAVTEIAGHQRRSGRDSLFLSADLRLPHFPDPFQVRVRNLSEGGLMAELAEPVDIGTGVQLELRGIGRVTGTIAWAAEGRVGIAFDRPIDPRKARKPVQAAPATPKPSRPL